MVSSWCAGSLLFVAFCSSLVCPFYYHTPRGILCLHWTTINYLASSSGFQPTDAGSLLVALATLLCLLEHTVNANKSESTLSSMERVSACCLLLCLDAACAVYGRLANTEISLLIFLAHVTLSVFLLLCHRRRERKLPTEQWIALNSGDLFCDSTNPFAFLGLSGFHYVIIVAEIIAQAPLLRSSSLLQNAIYILRSSATLGLIFSPPYLGGLVHAVKTAGARLAAGGKKCRKSLITQA